MERKIVSGMMLTLFLLISMLTLTFNVQPIGLAVPIDRGGGYVPGEVIVTFTDRIDFNVLASSGTIIDVIGGLRSVLVRIPYGLEEAFVSSVLKKSGVKGAERNRYVYAQFVPNDPDYKQQWHYHTIQVSGAWDVPINRREYVSNVLVAVVDTGVDYNHEDLKGRIWAGIGYDFVNEDDDPMDDNGHGTHVAGTVAAVINNSLGCAGAAPNATIMAVKVLNAAGRGTTWDIARGIVYAVDNGAKIVNLSLGQYDPSSILESATLYAYNEGALIVAAAGNDGIRGVIYPAAYPWVIAVSSIDYNSQPSVWGGTKGTNFGPEIELAAPGGGDLNGDGDEDDVNESVFSTLPNNNYGGEVGTSMATPHVSGVAALIWSLHPSLTNRQVWNTLITTADDLGQPGRDEFYGFGRVNALNAVLGAPKAENLTINFYGSQPEAYAGLKAGEIDIMDSRLTKEQYEDAESDPNITTAEFEELAYCEFGFNNNVTIPTYPNVTSPMSNISFRKALAYLVDKDWIVQVVLGGQAYRIDVPIPHLANEWWNEQVIYPNYPYEYNPAQAEAILDSAGFTDYDGDGIRNYPLDWPGVEGNLSVRDEPNLDPIIFYARSDDVARLKAAENLRDNMISLGIPVDWRPGDCGSVFRGDYHIYTGGWRVSRFPTYFYVMFTPIGIGGFNYYRINNPEITYWAEALWHATSFNDAKNYAKKVQELLVENAVSVWLWSYRGWKAHRKYYDNWAGEEQYAGMLWKGVVNELGVGVNSWWTFLNMHPDDTTGGTIRYGLSHAPNELNPVFSTWSFEWEVLDEIFDTLIQVNPGNLSEDLPRTAYDWTVGTWNDGGVQKTVLTFHLYPGIRFHDDKPLTSADVKFTIEYIKSYDDAWNYAWVADVHHVETPDNYTVNVYMDDLSMWYLYDIGGLPILPKHIYENIADPHGYTPGGLPPTQVLVGSGPYKLVDHSPGVGGYAHLEAFRQYFPSIRNVYISTVEPSATSVIQGETLNITVGGWIQPINISLLNKHDTITIVVYATNLTLRQLVPIGMGLFTFDPATPFIFIVNFAWNTSHVPPGNYTISATVEPLWGETNLADNTYINGVVEIKGETPKIPNVFITNIEVNPSTIFRGDPLYIELPIENNEPDYVTIPPPVIIPDPDPDHLGDELPPMPAYCSIAYVYSTWGGKNMQDEIQYLNSLDPYKYHFDWYNESNIENLWTSLYESRALLIDHAAFYTNSSWTEYGGPIYNSFRTHATQLASWIQNGGAVFTSCQNDMGKTQIWDWLPQGMRATSYDDETTSNVHIVYDPGYPHGLYSYPNNITDVYLSDGNPHGWFIDWDQGFNITVRRDDNNEPAELFGRFGKGYVVLSHIEAESRSEGSWEYIQNQLELQTTNVTIPPKTSITIRFKWNTTSVNPGYYTIIAKINPAPGVTDTFMGDTVTILPAHDVGVMNVTNSKTVVGHGYSAKINVTIANQGDYTETFNITVYANTTAIATQTVTLTSGNSATITFTWNTTEYAKGNYTLWAYAEPVQGETSIDDNSFADGTVYVGIPGDINADNIVDVYDLILTARAFGSKINDPQYNPNADINNDDIIDIYDLIIVAGHYGQIDP